MSKLFRSFDDIQVRKWIKKNRGILTRIAVTCACSPQFVQQVAYGYSTGTLFSLRKTIEKELQDAGWPGHKEV